jgi:hypothetical protein
MDFHRRLNKGATVDRKEWLKSAAVAVGGGAAAALSAAAMDPTKFNLANGLKDEALIALQGGLVGLAALFIRSPLGSSLMASMAAAKQQAGVDQATVDKARDDLKK